MNLYNNKYIYNDFYKIFCKNGIMETYAERLLYALDQSGLNQSQLASAIGVKPKAIQYLCKKGTKSTHTNAIARVLGVNPDWLDNGAGGMDNNYIEDQVIRQALPGPIVSNATWGPEFDLWDSSTPLREDEVALPFFREVRLSAGAGISEVQENHGCKLRFSSATLRRQSVDSSNAACVNVSGTSMEPVLPDGTTVGIDTSQKDIIDGKMYAIDHGGHLRVKLLYRLPSGGIRLRSYNQDEYPDEFYKVDELGELRILGKVFWYSVLL